MQKIPDITLFLNPCHNSYDRLGGKQHPVTSPGRRRTAPSSSAFRQQKENIVGRSCARRTPPPTPTWPSPPSSTPVSTGIKWELPLPEPADVNLQTASHEVLEQYQKLPTTLASAQCMMAYSQFVQEHFPKELISAYCSQV